jgi:hypothetical protein
VQSLSNLFILIDVGFALPMRGCDAKAKKDLQAWQAMLSLIALFVRAGMRRPPGDIFSLPENFFCAFPPRRRKIHSYYVFTLVENTHDLSLFSADSVEDNLANRERLDWHLLLAYATGT